MAQSQNESDSESIVKAFWKERETSLGCMYDISPQQDYLQGFPSSLSLAHCIFWCFVLGSCCRGTGEHLLSAASPLHRLPHITTRLHEVMSAFREINLK